MSRQLRAVISRSECSASIRHVSREDEHSKAVISGVGIKAFRGRTTIGWECSERDTMADHVDG